MSSSYGGHCTTLFLLLLTFIFSLSYLPTPSDAQWAKTAEGKKIICPSNATSEAHFTSCRCFPEHYGATVRCIGHENNYEEDINQDDINIMVALIRKTNDLSKTDILPLYRFFVEGSTLAKLDMTVFYKSRMALLCIQNNPNLVQLLHNKLDSDTLETIDVKQFALRYNAMTDDGFGETLRYFSAKSLEDLDLQKNRFEGSLRHFPSLPRGCIPNKPGIGLEFLPGLSAFTELQVLYAGRNNIKRLGGGQFQRNYKLRALVFDESKPFEIWENAFLIDFPKLDLINLPFWLFFRGMNMSTEAFANATMAGIINAARPMSLYLMANKIDTLPSDYFETFLNTRVENKLWLDQNPLVCDQRMKWLKVSKDVYFQDIKDAMCSNDAGQTVFTSKKIPTS